MDIVTETVYFLEERWSAYVYERGRERDRERSRVRKRHRGRLMDGGRKTWMEGEREREMGDWGERPIQVYITPAAQCSARFGSCDKRCLAEHKLPVLTAQTTQPPLKTGLMVSYGASIRHGSTSYSAKQTML